MKRIAFVSRRRIVAQGFEAALKARPELGLELLPLIPPRSVQTDAAVYCPDLALIDVTKDLDRDSLSQLCRELRGGAPRCSLVLLTPEDESRDHTLSVEAMRSGLVDDFVFYDSTMNYLLAKLAAL